MLGSLAQRNSSYYQIVAAIVQVGVGILTLSRMFIESPVLPWMMGWARLLVWERFYARAGCAGALAGFTGSVVIAAFDL
jgi:hypothetical protein